MADEGANADNRFAAQAVVAVVVTDVHLAKRLPFDVDKPLLL